MKRKLSLALAVILTVSLFTLPVQAASRTFTDVPATYWAYDAIMEMTDRGVVNGFTASTFGPGGQVTNAQFVVMMTQAFYADDLESTESQVDYWWGANMHVAQDAGLIDNTTLGNTYQRISGVDSWDANLAGQPMTRYDMAMVMYNYLRDAVEMPSASELQEAREDIGDYSSIPSGYQDAVATVYAMGCLNGTSAGIFDGSANMTRAQACVVMQRIMDAQSDNPSGETTRPEETETPDVDYKLTIALMNSNLSVGDKVFADMNTIPSTAKDDLTFTFKSSNTSVVTVKASSRNSFSCDITAVGPGTAVITATDSNGVTATQTITVTGSSTNTGTSTSDDYADVKDEIIELTNEVRAENDAGALKKSDLLMQIAQQRAEESAQMQAIDHGRPDDSFYNTIFAEYGLDIYSMNYQEILAWATTTDAHYAVNLWKNSSGHFNSMTNPNMTLVGVGVAMGNDGKTYYCQIFTNTDDVN